MKVLVRNYYFVERLAGLNVKGLMKLIGKANVCGCILLLPIFLFIYFYFSFCGAVLRFAPMLSAPTMESEIV